MTISKHILDTLKTLAGPKGWSDDPQEIAPHMQDWRKRYTGATPLLLKPDTVDSLSKIVRYCNETKTPLVPQGGNTGLVRGGIPSSDANEILLSFKRLHGVIDINTENNSITAYAGTPIQALHDAANKVDRTFGLSLASQGSCTAGGVASTNAGGIHVLRYGTTRDLIVGLEAVMPNGEIFSDLLGLKKDNTGYDIRNLLIGAEGTLGIITKVMFKLFPTIGDSSVLLAAIPSPKAALTILNQAQNIGNGALHAFELIPRVALDMVAGYMPDLTKPMAFNHDWYVLIEFSQSNPLNGFKEAIEAWLETLLDAEHILDGALAQNESQAKNFWAWREAISDAQAAHGPSLKHDVSVPLHHIPALLNQAEDVLKQKFPNIIPVMFGHMGDGNIHLNLSASKNMSPQDFYTHQDACSEIIYDSVYKLGGSFSAEHGIGTLKIAEMEKYKNPTSLRIMQAIKTTLDPNGIMNPGKVFL